VTKRLVAYAITLLLVRLLDYFIWCVSCTVTVLNWFLVCGIVCMCGCFGNMWGCVCVGFVMYGFVYVWVFW